MGLNQYGGGERTLLGFSQRNRFFCVGKISFLILDHDTVPYEWYTTTKESLYEK